MTDTLMTIIGIFVAVVLMILYPLIEVAGENDNIAQTTVQIAVSDFVNNVATEGKITQFEYDKLVQKLLSTGNSYEIIIEARILDENPEKRTVTTNFLKPTESQYYSVYTKTIEDSLKIDGEYLLKKDDYILVTIKNTNMTIGSQLKNIFYKFVGKNTYTIGANDSSLIINTGVTAKEDLKITAIPASDNINWTISMSKVSYKVEDMKPFNVVYIMDYSGSMGITNIERMHTTLINHVKELKEFTELNNSLEFNVSIIGFAAYAGELTRITVKNGYNITELENKLQEIKGKWEVPLSSTTGGLLIPGDLYGQQYESGHWYNPPIGNGTSYWAGAKVGTEVLNRLDERDNYIIFMTDGVEDDRHFTQYSFREQFDFIKEKAKGIYVVAYNYPKGENLETLEWCVRGVDKGKFFEANAGSLNNVFQEIMQSISRVEDGVKCFDKTLLAEIDVNKPIQIELKYGNTVVKDEILITEAEFAQYSEEQNAWYLYLNRLRKYYEKHLTSEEEMEVRLHITYYTIDIVN